MNLPSLCIGPDHPAFIGALGAGLVGAVLLSVVLGRLERPHPGPPRPRAHRDFAWFGMLAAVFIGPIMLLHGLFSWLHPDLSLCTSVVGRWFFLPPLVLFFGGALEGVRQRKHAAPAGNSSLGLGQTPQ